MDRIEDLLGHIIEPSNVAFIIRMLQHPDQDEPQVVPNGAPKAAGAAANTAPTLSDTGRAQGSHRAIAELLLAAEDSKLLWSVGIRVTATGLVVP
jgi:hypothetical protein